ncbi:MAG: PilZ domain-containing protein [Desulfuromonadales bacterium]|nr:PilZ domain-containing protein [Desulfuromonadales bacterium]
MDNYEEKRAAQRIPVELPVELDCGTARTRDISWSGIYFLTKHLMEQGDELLFSLDLDFVHPNRPIRMQCQAQVIRTEKLNGELGVAAKINSFRHFN